MLKEILLDDQNSETAALHQEEASDADYGCWRNAWRNCWRNCWRNHQCR